MSLPRLTLVREDTNIRVYTELYKHIAPHELSRCLLEAYGEDRFRISLRRDVYLIYVQHEGSGKSLARDLIGVKKHIQALTMAQLTQGESTSDISEQRSSDMAQARKLLLGEPPAYR